MPTRAEVAGISSASEIRPSAGSKPPGALEQEDSGSRMPQSPNRSERRLGEFFRRKTLMFNGYADQVASLYAGMDLRKFY